MIVITDKEWAVGCHFFSHERCLSPFIPYFPPQYSVSLLVDLQLSLLFRAMIPFPH